MQAGREGEGGPPDEVRKWNARSNKVYIKIPNFRTDKLEMPRTGAAGQRKKPPDSANYFPR
ncbi:MAG TPA: hypothetical protein DDZ83_05435 [Nitrospinae bacterium]|nr:hypothetical protein [Nitrospinota bacterium]